MPVPFVAERRGTLSFLRSNVDIPFSVSRVYFITGVPPDGRRGGHAHRRLRELVVALAGCFDVLTDDGVARRTHRLDDPSEALYLPAPVWRELLNFSPGAVCLVLGSEEYDPSDYVRDYKAFRLGIHGCR